MSPGGRAGVDSLEHGMWLDHDLPPRMAAQGAALILDLYAVGPGRSR